MELIKKRISVRNFQGGNVHFKIQLNQKIDDLGIATDMPYDDYSILTGNTPSTESLKFGSYTDTELIKHYKQAGQIVAVTDTRLNEVKSYDIDEPYKKDFDTKRLEYTNYKGETINGVDRVTNVDDEEITYAIGASADGNIGTTGQTSGLLFVDNPKDGLVLNNAESNEEMTTSVQYMGEGWNKTNTSIDAQIHEEYLIGIIGQPEVKSNVFIDRGVVSVLDKHLRLSEVESLDHLERYGNGFYNINRD